MPQVSKGAASNQNAGTPDELYQPIGRFWHTNHDLAADASNSKCGDNYFDEGTDSLSQKWHHYTTLDLPGWLNHPYENCTVWVNKAHDEALLGATVIMLQPLAVHRSYYRKYVKTGPCAVLVLNRPVTFIGYKLASPTPHAIYVWNRGLTGGIQGEYDYLDEQETILLFQKIKEQCI